MAGGSAQPVLRHIHVLATGADGATDAQLLDQFVSRRDEQAFAVLVERHGPMVLGVCRRVLPDAHAAEDVFQAVFLVLARKAGDIRKRESLGSWLHGVALRLAHKAKAQAARAARPDERPPIPVPDPLEEITWREVQQVLDAELHRLPERYRLPLVLCYLEGRTRDEAAAQLGWTAQQVKGQLERGREKLRGRLVRRGIALSAALSASFLADRAGAAVPPLLAVAIVPAAMKFSAGQPAATCGVSTFVATLAEGAVKSMKSTIWKTAAALLLLAGAVGTGVFAVPGQKPQADKTNATGAKAPPAKEEPPLRATFIEERGGKPPMRAYHVKLELANTRNQPVWLLLGYYGDEPLQADGKFTADHGGVPQSFSGMFFDGDKNKGRGKVIEISFISKRGFRAFLLPPRSAVQFDDFGVEAWKEIRTIDAWEASALKVNGKTPLQDWLPYPTMSDQKARIAPNTDWNNLDWDSKTQKSRTDYPSEKITSVDATVLKKWVVPIEGMPSAKPPTPAAGSDVGPPNPPANPLGATWRLAFTARLSGAGAGKIEFSPDGKTLVSSAKYPGRPQLWDIEKGEEIPLPAAGGRADFVGFTGEGRMLGVRYSPGPNRDPKTALTLLDLWTGKDLMRVELHDRDGIRRHRHVAVSADAKALAISDWPDKVLVFDVPTGTKRTEFVGGERPVQAIRFAPDGKSLVVAHSASRPNGQHSMTLLFLGPSPTNAGAGGLSGMTQEPLIDLAFSPDGKRLAGGPQDSTQIRVWDVGTGKETIRLGATTDTRRHLFLAFAPDGRTVAANWQAGRDNDTEAGVILWDAATGNEKAILKGAKGPVYAVAFSHDGSRLAAADMGKTLHVWTRK